MVLGNFWVSGSATVRVSGTQPQGKIVDSGGATVEVVRATPGGLVFQLAYREGWKVTSIKADETAT